MSDTHSDQVKRSGLSKIARYLRSRRLAAVLGFVLYVVPSPIYVGAAKAIADTKLSNASELLGLLAVVAVMLWMIELPMLMLVIIPGRAEHTLDRTNAGSPNTGGPSRSSPRRHPASI